MKILICDDHAVFREGLVSVLEEIGAEFLETADGAGVLGLVDEDPDVALVLLDLRLPDEDGWSVLRGLRSRHPAVPVVILSASEDPTEMRRALDGGASGFIPKSASNEVLRAAVKLVLSGGVYVPREALAEPPGSPDERRRQRATQLTPRQLEVLQLMSRGLTNAEIAGVLKIAEGTVKAHVAALLQALDVSNRTEAALVMRELGLEES